jgi:hypothetical protein
VDTLQDVAEGLSETFVGVNDALLTSGSLSKDPRWGGSTEGEDGEAFGLVEGGTPGGR